MTQQPPHDRAADPPRGLRLRPPLREPGTAPPPPVRLVREHKGPTVADVIAAASSDPPALPGRLVTALDTLAAGDATATDRAVDRALRVLPGPGRARRRRRWVLRVVLWLVALALAITSAAVASR